MRVEKLEPHHQWTTIWKNLWDEPIPLHTRAWWYHILHDILPTNHRPHKISTVPTETCNTRRGYLLSPPSQMRLRTRAMVLDKSMNSHYIMARQNMDTRSLAHAPPTGSMAPKTTSGRPMAACIFRHLSGTK
jgi:hypothetical protein